MTSKAEKRRLNKIHRHLTPSWWRGSWSKSDFDPAERRRRRARDKRAKASKKRNRPS